MPSENPIEALIRRLTETIKDVVPSAAADLDHRVRDAVASLTERFQLVPKGTFDARLEELEALQREVDALEARVRELESNDD